MLAQPLTTPVTVPAPIIRLCEFRPVLCTQSKKEQLDRMLSKLTLIRESSDLMIAELTAAIAALKVKPHNRFNIRLFADGVKLQLYYSLLRDVIEQSWNVKDINITSRAILLEPPGQVEKEIVRSLMTSRRQELIDIDQQWVSNTQGWIGEHLANGQDINPNRIIPKIEVCETDKQNDIFRYLRYTWSSPYSEYVGRRIRFIIRDAGQKSEPVIGIAALGSSIMQIAERDQWIGWLPKDDDIRELRGESHWQQMRAARGERIISMMDMYVCGSIPPYSFLTGGKLICYMMASNEVREIFRKKYQNKTTLIKKRKSSDLVLLCTTSLYGSHSSQYNRITYRGQPLYTKVGETKGFGSLHVSEATFELMRFYLNLEGITLSHKFGSGVNWKMRVIRTALQALELDQDLFLQHTFSRSIYVAPYARNAREYLTYQTNDINYYHRPLTGMIRRWKNRWMYMRLNQDEVHQQIQSFRKEELFVV